MTRVVVTLFLVLFVAKAFSCGGDSENGVCTCQCLESLTPEDIREARQRLQSRMLSDGELDTDPVLQLPVSPLERHFIELAQQTIPIQPGTLEWVQAELMKQGGTRRVSKRLLSEIWQILFEWSSRTGKE